MRPSVARSPEPASLLGKREIDAVETLCEYLFQAQVRFANICDLP